MYNTCWIWGSASTTLYNTTRILLTHSFSRGSAAVSHKPWGEEEAERTIAVMSVVDHCVIRQNGRNPGCVGGWRGHHRRPDSAWVFYWPEFQPERIGFWFWKLIYCCGFLMPSGPIWSVWKWTENILWSPCCINWILNGSSPNRSLYELACSGAGPHLCNTQWWKQRNNQLKL